MLTDTLHEIVSARERLRGHIIRQFAVIEARKVRRELTPIELGILETVYRSGGTTKAVSSGDIAKELAIADSTLSQAVTRMAKQYLARAGGGVRLTECGSELTYRLASVDNLLLPRFLAGLDARVGSTVWEGLRRAVAEAADLSHPAGSQMLAVARVAERRGGIARLYDYLSGGNFWFPADKEAGDGLLSVSPLVGEAARANRSFMRRAVTYAASTGIRQIIDIGSGIAAGNGSAHELLPDSGTDCNVLYLDNDEYVVKANKLILAEQQHVNAETAEFTDVEAIFKAAAKHGFDFGSKETLVLAIAVAHFVEDLEAVRRALGELRGRLKTGSLIALSHAHFAPGVQLEGEKALSLYTSILAKAWPRGREEIQSLFSGLKLEKPSDAARSTVVFSPEWRADIDDPFLFSRPGALANDRKHSFALVGVGRVAK